MTSTTVDRQIDWKPLFAYSMVPISAVVLFFIVLFFALQRKGKRLEWLACCGAYVIFMVAHGTWPLYNEIPAIWAQWCTTIFVSIYLGLLIHKKWIADILFALPFVPIVIVLIDVTSVLAAWIFSLTSGIFVVVYLVYVLFIDKIDSSTLVGIILMTPLLLFFAGSFVTGIFDEDMTYALHCLMDFAQVFLCTGYILFMNSILQPASKKYLIAIVNFVRTGDFKIKPEGAIDESRKSFELDKRIPPDNPEIIDSKLPDPEIGSFIFHSDSD